MFKKLAFFIFLLSLSILLTGCNSNDEDNLDINNNQMTQTIQKLDSEKSCENQTGQKACPAEGEEIAVIETNYGAIKIKFFEAEAPKTVANFKKLANEKYYDELTFHRIIKNFMIQGGDPDGTGSGGPGYTIEAEITDNLSHVAGAVATARLSDIANPQKASSGSQFYIVHNDTGALSLDEEYTIFAQVIEGQNVVDKIATQITDSNDRPLKEVIIEKIYLEKYN